jgi:hypothetical protein
MTDRELLELYDYHYPLAPNQLAYLINLFAKAEQEKEREACAKLCLETEPFYGVMFADAIRARG